MAGHESSLRDSGALRAEIDRSRRRIAAHVSTTRSEVRELLSWREYVARYPLWSIAGALGLGIAISAGLRPRRFSRHVGASLGRFASDALKQFLWAQARNILKAKRER